jgi:hypothetical protein
VVQDSEDGLRLGWDSSSAPRKPNRTGVGVSGKGGGDGERVDGDIFLYFF